MFGWEGNERVDWQFLHLQERKGSLLPCLPFASFQLQGKEEEEGRKGKSVEVFPSSPLAFLVPQSMGIGGVPKLFFHIISEQYFWGMKSQKYNLLLFFSKKYLSKIVPKRLVWGGGKGEEGQDGCSRGNANAFEFSRKEEKEKKRRKERLRLKCQSLWDLVAGEGFQSRNSVLKQEVQTPKREIYRVFTGGETTVFMGKWRKEISFFAPPCFFFFHTYL